MYAKPSTSKTKRKGKKDTREKEHILNEDPRKTLVKVRLDLSEISEIRTPFPDEEWVYHVKDSSRKKVYVQIDVISNDAKKTKASYLRKKRTKIYCDRIIPGAGPEEQEIPIVAVKSLKIEGFKDREAEKSKERKEKERAKIRELSKELKEKSLKPSDRS